MAWTKEQRSEYMKNWRLKNKDKIKEYCHKSYMKSKLDGTYTCDTKKANENTRKWRQNNKQKWDEYCKKWRTENRESYNAYHREYQRKLRQKLAIEKWGKI